jgi:hypothetical protein
VQNGAQWMKSDKGCTSFTAIVHESLAPNTREELEALIQVKDKDELSHLNWFHKSQQMSPFSA